MRTFRRRRFGRRTVRRVGRRSRRIRRMMMVRRRIKRFVNKMGYPTYVKMIGMTESKRLLLRKTLTLDASYTSDSTAGQTTASTNIFQIMLNPLECPNVSKVFSMITINVTKDEKPTPASYGHFFRYDYLKVRNIFISIKPSQSVSTLNTSAYGDAADESGISNVYAYFTYRYPMISPNDAEGVVQQMYGTAPIADRIVQEGRLKNVYTWPSNKPMTISLSNLRYRVINEPHKICANSPIDIQYLSSLASADGHNDVYDPFKFSGMQDIRQAQQLEEENNLEEEAAEYGAQQGGLEIPDLNTRLNLFFGRLVIVSPKKVRFTTEICYDCVMYR